MQLKADLLSIEAGGPLIVVMNRDDAADLGVISSDRVFLRYKENHAICILNISTEDEPGILGIYGEVKDALDIQEGDMLSVELARRPESIDYVREKFPKTSIVGFKAEVGISKEELENRAQKSLTEHKIDMVVANFLDKPEQGFASKTNEVILVQKNKKSMSIPLKSKREISKIIIDELLS